MIVGVPKEIKNNESRVSMLPFGIEDLVKSGHTVLIEKNAAKFSSKGLCPPPEETRPLSLGNRQ